jgi:hypothetical protein
MPVMYVCVMLRAKPENVVWLRIIPVMAVAVL